ncbi:hypothetical protein B0H14DRAFT_3855940 [Mycena olivaceomarginata]|nr:hypothetical protein B0H14DRAFT_3855940 [Mycena olivaceomarginata]
MPAIPVITYVLGGWDLGVSGDLILQGVLFAQFAHYLTLYTKDIMFLRAYVMVLLLTTTLKTVQVLVIMWFQNVVFFTDIGGAANMFFNFWPSQMNLSFVALIAFYVQVFFCQRLWVISRNVYVVVLLGSLFLIALVAAFVASAATFKDDSYLAREWLAIHLGIVFAGDLILCGSTAYFLLIRSKQVSPQTAGMLNAILKLTFQSAAPAAFCALINLVCSQAGNTSATSNGWSMCAIISNTILPKLYAISAMWTLNSRKDIRLARSNGQTTSSGDGPSGRRRTNNVELGVISGARNIPIQVRTQVQTIQRADDIFSKSHLDAMDKMDAERDSNKDIDSTKE